VVLTLVVFAAALVACGKSNSNADAQQETLTVVDQNILHGLIDEDPAAPNNDRFAERIQLFADAIGKEKPDILFMQEIVGSPEDPNYPDPRKKVLDALGSDYQAVFGNFLAGPIDAPGLGQLTVTKLPITAKENHRVSKIRSVQHIALKTKHGTVDVYNAHLEGSGAVLETGADASVAEMDEVIKFIDQTRDGSGPVILAGDLNAKPDSPSIQRLVGAGFTDALATAGDATCAKQGDPGCSDSRIPLGDNPKNLTDERIDYMFVKPGDRAIRVKNAQRFLPEAIDIGGGHTLYVSDHIGLIVELEIKSVEG
jgi:endonuclease/exonuclease/phosphatase family metal-dependent hydrolase